MLASCPVIRRYARSLQVDRRVNGGLGAPLVHRVVKSLSGQGRVSPQCGHVTARVRDYHPRRERALLKLQERRFLRVRFGEVFTEPDEVCGWRTRSTKQFGASQRRMRIAKRRRRVSEPGAGTASVLLGSPMGHGSEGIL